MPNREKKLLVGVWLHQKIVEAVQEWLRDHPKLDYTAFLVLASDELLKKENIHLPREVVISRNLRKTQFQGTQLQNVDNRFGIPDRPRKKPGPKPGMLRAYPSPKSRKHMQLLTARVHETFVAGIEQWLAAHPGTERTVFFRKAIIEKLRKAKIPVPKEVIREQPRRRPLPLSAFTGIHPSVDFVVYLAESAERMRKLADKSDQLRKSKRFVSMLVEAKKQPRLTERYWREMLEFMRRLQWLTHEVDKASEEAGELTKG